MSLITFAREYELLTPNEQAQIADVVRRLLSEGILWREEEADRRIYNFIVRRRELIADYLQVGGWELRHDERVAAFQVVHREGAHRRRFTRDTTIWLLILRLMYAEQRESPRIMLTRNPVATVGELASRYAEFFPGKVVRKKGSLEEALRTLQHLKLIRPAGTPGTLRAANSEQLIELLPVLEMVVPAGEISAIAERIREYDRAQTAVDEDVE